MISTEQAKELKVFAKQIQIETVNCIASLGVGHLGGSLSIADTLAVLYGKHMKYDPENPKWDDRDLLVLSKGHAGPALYATLALRGFFNIEMLNTLNKPGTLLPSHVDMNRTPGVDMTCGSLGQGGSAAAGIAMANKMNNKDSYTYLIFGDGELNEGQVWEAALFAAAKKLDHLIGFVDRNMLQIDGGTEDVCPLGDVASKFNEFGWYSQTVDGHDVKAISDAIDNAKLNCENKPSMIVLNTVKGEGWSKSADNSLSHNMNISEEEAKDAIAQMESAIHKIKVGE